MNLQILKRIRDNISPQKFFQSVKMISYFTGIARMVTTYNRTDKIYVRASWDQWSESIAYTNNKKIYINLANSLSLEAGGKTGNKERMLLSYLGLEGHELGHALCSDFEDIKKINDAWSIGKWYPWRPVFEKQEYIKSLDEIEKLLNNKSGISVLIKLMKEIDNCIEDRYVEYFISNEYPGTFRHGINLLNKIMFKGVLEQIKNNDDLTTVLMQLIQYAVKMQKFPADSRFPFLDDLYAELRKTDSLNDVVERVAMYERVLVITWTVFGKIAEKADTEKYTINQNITGTENENELHTNTDDTEKESHAGNKDKSNVNNDRTEKILNSINKAINNNPKGKTQRGTGTGEIAQRQIKNRTAADKKKQENTSGSSFQATSKNKSNISSKARNEGDGKNVPKDSSKSEENAGKESCLPVTENGTSEISANPAKPADDPRYAIDDILGGITDSYIENHPAVKNESIACEVAAESAYHKNIPCHVTVPDINGRNKYDEVFGRVKKVSKKLQRVIGDRIKDREEGGVLRGLLMGERINPAASANQNGKIFKREVLPEDTPQLAVCLLVDESGSMNGIKIAKALETAILLEDFCRGLNLPISVIGHSYYDGVRLNQYIMFDGNKNDKYRLASMSAGGDNRDGFALRYCIKLLEKRQEPGKLLILISDGQPLAPDYYGETAYADLKDAKSMCKKRNITLFTAAIDADKQQIKKIYGGECFLDITNLNELPQKMLRLVLKELNK